MKTHRLMLTLAYSSLMVLSPTIAYADGIVYKPPASTRGIPSGRVGPGTRHSEVPKSEPHPQTKAMPKPKMAPTQSDVVTCEALPGTQLDAPSSLTILSPPEIAHTSQAQPTLYWAVGNACASKVEISLRETFDDPLAAPAPLLETTLQLSKNGIYALPLASHGVSLDINKEYEFVLSVIIDPNNPAFNKTTQTILLRDQADEVAAQAEHLLPADKPAFYAEQGFWYDALEAVFNLPQEREDVKAMKSELLEQGQIPQGVIQLELVQ